MKNTRGGDNLRQDAPRREEHASARHKRTHAAFYLALSSPPSARCRRHSVRPPRERNSSLRGLINDHWIFQRRRNHFHLLRYLGAILRPPLPPPPPRFSRCAQNFLRYEPTTFFLYARNRFKC